MIYLLIFSQTWRILILNLSLFVWGIKLNLKNLNFPSQKSVQKNQTIQILIETVKLQPSFEFFSLIINKKIYVYFRRKKSTKALSKKQTLMWMPWEDSCIHSTPINPDFFDYVFGPWLLIRHFRVFFEICNVRMFGTGV